MNNNENNCWSCLFLVYQMKSLTNTLFSTHSHTVLHTVSRMQACLYVRMDFKVKVNFPKISAICFKIFATLININNTWRENDWDKERKIKCRMKSLQCIDAFICIAIKATLSIVDFVAFKVIMLTIPLKNIWNHFIIL